MASLIYLHGNPQPFKVREDYDEIRKLLYPEGNFGADVLAQADYIELHFVRELTGGASSEERLAFNTSAIQLFGEYNEVEPAEARTVAPAVAVDPEANARVEQALAEKQIETASSGADDSAPPLTPSNN